jgi:hypothetical protein
MTKLSCCLCLFLIPAQSPAQSPDDDGKTRALWDSTFLSQRPLSKKPLGPAAPSVAPQARPVREDAALIGLTFWRLRPATRGNNERARVFVHDKGGELQWTPERVHADGLGWGQLARFSIETDREGFLYIIDRERYSDGAVGDPTLVFPTRALRGGNNHLLPGMLVDVPAWGDDPPYLRLDRSRPEHVGELLTILLTTEPLSDITPGDDRIGLPADLVVSWEKRWGAPYRQLEANNLAGEPMTTAEQQASTQAVVLTRTDPPPQTLYRLTPKAPGALLITIPVLIR